MKKTVLSGLSVLYLLTAGCSSQQTLSLPVNSTAHQERALYEQGLRSLSRSDYKGAGQAFVDLLHKYPATKWTSGANYNLGLALEGQDKYAEAADVYKKVIEINQSTPESRDEADALYRLSICYETLQDDGKMTLALLQLQDKKEFLPKQTAEMEIPARLAASYARQGNLDQAKTYYAKAAKELKRYRRPPMIGDVMVWLPKTLYSMGTMKAIRKDVTLKEFRDYLNSVNETQGWLVRAAELGNNTWSRKAADNLEDIYLSLITAIRDFKVSDSSDKVLAAEQQQEAQKAMAKKLDEAIVKLKLERLPPSPAEPEAGRLTEAFTTIDQVEKNVTTIVQGHDIRDQNTPEAQVHEGLRQ